jgi:hypothetical protein
MNGYQSAISHAASPERQDARRMPASSSLNGYPISPAAALLNPKAYQKQMANGITSDLSLLLPSSITPSLRSGSEPPHSGRSPTLSLNFTFPHSQDNAHFFTYPQGPGRSKKAASVNGDVPLSTPHFDPKQLLNPKGFNKIQGKEDTQVKSPTVQKYQPEYSDPNPRGLPEAQAHANGAPQRECDSVVGEVQGMGNLIERMHNVSKREEQPRKRQKKEHASQDDQDDMKKATFAGGGKGGVIGEYMRQQREEGKKESQPTRMLVDLTTGMESLFNLPPCSI